MGRCDWQGGKSQPGSPTTFTSDRCGLDPSQIQERKSEPGNARNLAPDHHLAISGVNLRFRQFLGLSYQDLRFADQLRYMVFVDESVVAGIHMQVLRSLRIFPW